MSTKQIKADTARGAAALLKDGKPGQHAAGAGLYLKVSAPGLGSWFFRYKIDGKTRRMGLGATDTVTLAEARAVALEQRALLSKGIDPMEHRDALQRQQNATLATFDGVAAAYIAAHRSGWKNAKHAQQWENTLKTYASPVIGKLAPSNVTTAHVLEALNKNDFWSNKPETASRVRNRIELILDAAKARGMREGENPARWRGHLDKLLPGHAKIKKVKHHPALPYQQLPDFLENLRQRDGTGARALEFAVLTAVRSGEVRAAEWYEIDLKAGVWTIPAERMKTNSEHRVPLSDEAVTLLRALPRIADNDLVFPATRGKQMSDMTLAAVIRRMHIGEVEAGRLGYIDPKQRSHNGDYRMVTPHGFRSTFRDWAGECTAHSRDVCEQALAHSLGNAVEAAYRRGDLFEKRRVLMTDWATYCTTKPASNVIPIQQATA